MSSVRDLPSSSAKPPGGNGGSSGSLPDASAALLNLSNVKSRMDKLHRFLSDSVNASTIIGKEGMDMVSTEIASAVHQIIVNGAALLALTRSPCLVSRQHEADLRSGSSIGDVADGRERGKMVDPKVESVDQVVEEDGEDYEIIELDAVEILAEHIHFCDICGKGFKRDANLRMHMRAHGNQFKTPEALAKPPPPPPELLQQYGGGVGDGLIRKTRFSCPYVGCNRNKKHKKFRALKSAVCVKNHFKRSHCPKMYSCNRCNKKSFSVMADLKSHLKHCGDTKWKCSCGTSFSRKDKLFGHMALFEGHMPAVAEEQEVIGKVTESSAAAATAILTVEDNDDEGEEEEEQQMDLGNEFPYRKDEFFDGLMFDGFDSTDQYCFQDLVGSPNQANKYSLGIGIDEFVNF